MNYSSTMAWKDVLANPNPLHSGCGDHTNNHANNHAVQFYDSNDFLSEAVSNFIATGLDAGEAVIIIARSEQVPLFKDDLTLMDCDFEKAIETGQLIFLDADQTLSQFMMGVSPDWDKFQNAIGGLLETMKARYSKIRAYGEMVDILRANGNLDGMIKLEEYWNDLAKQYSFSLLCGYSMQGFARESTADAFEQLCSTHSHVLPAETFKYQQDQETQNRTIALLQRKAEALSIEIKDRIRMEQELLKNEKHLKDAVRTRDEFLAIASHELKTPLTSLRLLTQLQQRRIANNDLSLFERKNVLKLINTFDTQTERLTKLVEDMLDSSRITYGKLNIEKSEVDLSALVREVVDRFDGQLKEGGVRLRFTVDTSIVGQWDKHRIEQVISNLLTNAMKYGLGKPIELSLTQTSEKVRLVVSDQGIGIAKDNLERVFQRFERAISVNEVSGLGLGLYICRQIVEAHEGRIWCESELGRGTTVSVELPV